MLSNQKVSQEKFYKKYPDKHFLNIPDLQANWSEDGSATFHTSCWNTLLKATEVDSTEIKLKEQEKKLIKEARKTAEYHNSEDHFQTEADRIVKMLKNSSYCIGFTGKFI